MKKNLFTLAMICTIGSILFSSCSMTKRRYTSGYYVSHNSKQTDVKTQQISQQKKNPSLNTVKSVSEINQVATEPRPVPNNGAVTASNKQETIAKKTTSTIKKYRTYQELISPIKKTTHYTSTKKVSADSLAGDAFSLFWIIILILLILWLVAILSGGWGLGGFVYLLLVVALILLILWLLRII